MIRPFLAALALACVASPALAQTATALVENVDAKQAGVGFMDYLPAGKVIALATGESLTLSYLKSCAHERIVGGTVTVGTYQSEVSGGNVDRDVLRCDAGKLALTAAQTDKSGATVFRRAPVRADALPAAELTLYGTTPALIVPGGGTVVIERFDRAEAKLEIAVVAPGVGLRSFHDLASEGRALAPGGLYRASVGSRQIVFKVDANAVSGPVPLIARLLQFGAD